MSKKNLVDDIVAVLRPLREERGDGPGDRGWSRYTYLELEKIAAPIIEMVRDNDRLDPRTEEGGRK